jgi:hypothetical protein
MLVHQHNPLIWLQHVSAPSHQAPHDAYGGLLAAGAVRMPCMLYTPKW